MANTMNGSTPWEYIDLLNECIRILVTIGIGILMSYFHIFDAKIFVPMATKFVFYVALPLHVLRGIGMGVNFYDDQFSWIFIVSFLILRVMALVVAFGWAWCQGENIGHVAVVWLSLSWISTIILGIPISTAVFGSPQIGAKYGLLAAISSFIFQLPFQLFFLECHALEQQQEDKPAPYTSSSTTERTPDPNKIQDKNFPVVLDDDLEANKEEASCPGVIVDHDVWKTTIPEDSIMVQDDDAAAAAATKVVDECAPPVLVNSADVAGQNGGEEDVPCRETHLSVWYHYMGQKYIWKKILIKLVQNPVIWGIVGGFVLSLSTIGPRFLNPINGGTPDEYVPGLGWIWSTTEWLGACVSPVTLFTMGVWMHDYNTKLLVLPLHSAVSYMVAKLVVLPALMMGLAVGLGFSDEAGRAAILIAALPVSMASFALSSQYHVGEAVLAANVALGTALLLPTILLWNLFLDAIELFPITRE